MVSSSSGVPRPWPTAPTSEVWATLSPEQRRQTVARLEAMGLPEELQQAMGEGDRHMDAKIAIRETLRTYFGRGGQRVYVGAELSVFYPGHPIFVPDILAVRDVDPHPRTSWFVSAEGKGVEFVLEVLVEGSRKKDLVDNLERYARLGIEEYFVLDIQTGHLHGHRLADASGRPRYERMVPQAGVFTSAVLGLELGLVGGALRFYHGSAQLLTAQDLAGKLERMVDELVVKHDEATAARARLEAQLRQTILALMAARGLTLDETAQARLEATTEAEVLGRWAVRAATVTTVAALFADD
jgi:Uma2 family endonuclease